MRVDQPNASMVSDLEAMAPGEERAWVGARDDARGDVRALCGEVETLVIADLARATAVSARVVVVSDLVGENETRAAARRIRAQALAYANRLDEALALLAEASEVLEGGSASLETARVELATLHSLARLGRHAEGVVAGERARAAFARAGELVQAARAEINIGAVERMRGEPLRAIEAFARARGALANEPVLRAQLESNCAEALLDVGRFDEAARSFRESLGAFETAGLDRAAAIVEGNLADLFARQGLLEAALRHFERAQRKFGAMAAPGDAARLEVEYADALAATGLREEAVLSYEHAIPVLREHKLAWEVIRGELGLGRTLLDVGRTVQAEEALGRAESAAEAFGNRAATARALAGRAQARRRAGDLGGARELLMKAEALTKDHPVEHLRTRLKLAMVGWGDRDGAAARGEVDGIVSEARRLGVPPMLADALQLRARYERCAGRMDLASEDLRSAIEQVERTRGALQAERFRTAYAGDRHALYEECVGAILDDAAGGGAEGAFSMVERSKSRSLLDLLHQGVEVGPAGTDEANERELLEELGSRRGELNALYSELDPVVRRRGEAGRAEDPAAWSARATTQEREIARLERRIAAVRPRLTGGAEAVDLSTAKKMLGPRTVLLEYFGECGVVSVIACDGGARTEVCRSVCTMDEVREELEEIHFAITRLGEAGDQGASRRSLAALYGLLIEPVEAMLRGAEAVVVVPTGALYGVPFHALGPSEMPLCAGLRVSQVPSASVLGQLRAREGVRAGRGALVVGLSDEVAPRSEQEAESVAGVLAEATLLVGREATRANVMRASRGKALVHIATHGRFLMRNPMESGVRLADGWLTVRDAYRMGLDGAHVTLSACDTGRVLASPGDEAWGLVRGFLAGGAGSLLLSLWALNDASASEMMTECYRACHGDSEGLHPTESLRRVVTKRARAGADPLLWAPFVYVGAP